jgi:hypothetical protein
LQLLEGHDLKASMGVGHLPTGSRDRAVRHEPGLVDFAAGEQRHHVRRELRHLRERKCAVEVLGFECIALRPGHLVARPDGGDIHVLVDEPLLGPR